MVKTVSKVNIKKNLICPKTLIWINSDLFVLDVNVCNYKLIWANLLVSDFASYITISYFVLSEYSTKV